MKKIFMFPLMVAAIALTGCGKNLGKEVDRATFSDKVAEFEKNRKEMPDLEKVESKGHMKSTELGIDMDLTTTIAESSFANPDQTQKAVMNVIEMVTVDYAENHYKEFGITPEKKYWYDGKEEYVGLSVKGKIDENIFGISVEAELDCKYQWNKYGNLVYASEYTYENASYGGETKKAEVKLELELNYFYKA